MSHRCPLLISPGPWSTMRTIFTSRTWPSASRKLFVFLTLWAPWMVVQSRWWMCNLFEEKDSSTSGHQFFKTYWLYDPYGHLWSWFYLMVWSPKCTGTFTVEVLTLTSLSWWSKRLNSACWIYFMIIWGDLTWYDGMTRYDSMIWDQMCFFELYNIPYHWIIPCISTSKISKQ